MRNILWLAVFSCLFTYNGYTQALVVDTAFAVETEVLIFSNITLGEVELYSNILDSLALAEELVKTQIDTAFYIKPVADYYQTNIDDVEIKFKIIKKRPGYLEVYAHGETSIVWGIIPVEVRGLVKYWYKQESDSTVQNIMEVYFKSENVLIGIIKLISNVVENTIQEVLEYIRIVGEKVYRNKLIR